MTTKIWVGGATGATGDWETANNWKPIDRRTAALKWTASGSGTNEYYLELVGGGDPSQETPGKVQIAGSDATEGTVGSLTAGQWDYGDNDTLGFNTLYVRLSDGSDPDTKDSQYITYTAVPIATDDVRIPASSAYAIDDGLDQSAVAIGDFTVESGYTKAIGTSTEYLKIDPNSFNFAGSGTAYIDITTAAIAPNISNTASPATGKRGLYLIGSAMSTLNVSGGSVGLCWNAGETATAATVRVSGTGSLWIGSGATLTTVYATAGTATLGAACTTLTMHGGIVTTEGSGTITTANVYGGTCYANSTGTITTANLDGGTLDVKTGKTTRTITTLNYLSGTLAYDPAVVTLTNRTLATRPVTYTTS